jgi:stage V sporulation protein B
MFLPKNLKIKKENLKPDKFESKEILNITIPSISGRLLGNIGYFFEPIILTNILLLKGFNVNYITLEYGIYNAYSVSLLLFPSFFISAISNALMPEISKLASDNNKKQIKRRIKQSLIISIITGIICTTFIYIFKEELLLKLYNTNKGINYIKTLTPFFILFYLEAPLSSILIGINKIKTCTIISVTGVILKLIIMTILAYLGKGIYSLVYAEVINIIYVTLLNYYYVKKSIYT